MAPCFRGPELGRLIEKGKENSMLRSKTSILAVVALVGLYLGQQALAADPTQTIITVEKMH